MRLCAWTALLFACLAGTGARAAPSAVNFDGGKVAGCSLASKVYTCNKFPLNSDTDQMAIATDYTVNIKGSAAFGYNQGLAMSGTAVLNVSGDLNIGDINPPNLSITGGSLISSGVFTIGNQAQTITADVSAASMNLGSGSTTRITGSVSATGDVTIGSHCTIVGTVSGSTIATNSPVAITGNVTATTSFKLASGSTVSGNIVAPVVTLDSSQSTVTGTITARTSLELGSSDTVNGDISAGNLVLDSSNAIVNGNATVASATLNWAGRVTKTIYCTGGTASGQCDCVTNNSGFAVNTVNGPHCAAPASPLDHFLIVHDGVASACSPEPVTVKACANAACSSLYTGGVNVTLQPGGASVAIGSSGANANATVSQDSVGNAALSVSASSVAPAAGFQCIDTANGNGAGSGPSYCTINFNNSIGLSMAIPDQTSGSNTAFSLTALVLDQNGKSCKPAFPGQTVGVQFSCAYANPASGSLPLLASTDGKNFSAINATDGGLCGGSPRILQVPFQATGSAALTMNYADVGQVRVNATLASNYAVTTSASPIVAPARFQVPVAPAQTTAGVAFSAVTAALNAAGNPTPNFGKETTPETVTFSLGTLGTSGCKMTPDVALGNLSAKQTVSGGTVTGSLTYTEAGAFNVQVQQTSSKYLGGAIARPGAVQTTIASGCGAVRSVPAYFQVHEGRVGSGLAGFYYSGEPVDVTVTAMNAAGATTLLYDNSYGYSNPVQFTPIDAAGHPIASSVGVLSGTGSSASAPLPASAFANGVAATPANAPLVFSFVPTPHAPLNVWLRASETATGGVSSAAGPTYHQTSEDPYEARSGRLRIGGSFGGAASTLALPVTAEYWTGFSWLRNVADTVYTINGNKVPLHPIPVGAVAIVATAPLLKPSIVANAANPPSCVVGGKLWLQAGQCSLMLQPAGGIGTATVAINLGSTSTDNSCVQPGPPPPTTGAAMPWMRGPNGLCIGSFSATADPVARATFGAFPPETKRLIHVREVFN